MLPVLQSNWARIKHIVEDRRPILQAYAESTLPCVDRWRQSWTQGTQEYFKVLLYCQATGKWHLAMCIGYIDDHFIMMYKGRAGLQALTRTDLTLDSYWCPYDEEFIGALHRSRQLLNLKSGKDDEYYLRRFFYVRHLLVMQELSSVLEYDPVANTIKFKEIPDQVPDKFELDLADLYCGEKKQPDWTLLSAAIHLPNMHVMALGVLSKRLAKVLEAVADDVGDSVQVHDSKGILWLTPKGNLVVVDHWESPWEMLPLLFPKIFDNSTMDTDSVDDDSDSWNEEYDYLEDLLERSDDEDEEEIEEEEIEEEVVPDDALTRFFARCRRFVTEDFWQRTLQPFALRVMKKKASDPQDDDGDEVSALCQEASRLLRYPADVEEFSSIMRSAERPDVSAEQESNSDDEGSSTYSESDARADHESDPEADAEVDLMGAMVPPDPEMIHRSRVIRFLVTLIRERYRDNTWQLATRKVSLREELMELARAYKTNEWDWAVEDLLGANDHALD